MPIIMTEAVVRAYTTVGREAALEKMCSGTMSDCESGIYGVSVKGEIVPYCEAHEGIGVFSQSPRVLKRDYPEKSHVVFCRNKKRSF